MTKRISIPYGFNRMVIGDMNLFTIKLKFNPFNTDPVFEQFFADLGFTSFNARSKDFKRPHRIYQYQSTDVRTFESTCAKVQDYLIRRKISDLYTKLAKVNTGSFPQSAQSENSVSL